MNTKIRFLLSLVAWLFFFAPISARSFAPEFYKGKTLRIIVGYAAGGGFDLYSRAISRHIGRHIPGNPIAVVENMPGAGGIILGNYLQSQAKPDGLTVGNIIGSLAHQQLFGTKGIEFDMSKFNWVGVPVEDLTACALTKPQSRRSLRQGLRPKKPGKLAG